jgi:hypothetical protein
VILVAENQTSNNSASQNNPPATQGPLIIPKPLASGATDNPNAPQSGPVASFSSLENDASYFPLLSKSPGFADAMIKANQSGDFDNDSTMPLSLVMSRNLRVMEGSDLYKDATPQKRMAYQLAFFKKYVEPITRSTGTKVEFKEWLKDRGTYWQYQVNPAAQDKILGGLLPIPKKVLKDVEKNINERNTALASGVASGVLHTLKAGEEAKRLAHQEFTRVTSELSLGSALLNPHIAPYVVPEIFNKEYLTLRESGKEQEIDQYLKDDKWVAENGYQQSISNKLLRGAGEMTVQIPAFMASDGLLEGLQVPEVLGMAEATGLKKIASRSIYNAAQGLLVGPTTGEDPLKAARNFGLATLVIEPPMMFLSKLWGWGGGKLLSPMIDNAANAVKTKSVETVVSPVSTALAGSQKQKISAATVQSLNDLTGGNFYKATDVAKKQALAKLAKAAPELAEQISFIEKNAVGVDAAKDLVRQRASVPQLNDVLAKLEKASGKETHAAVAESLSARAQAQTIVKKGKSVADVLHGREIIDPDTGEVVPGAASAKSLEFGDNLSKHIDSQLTKLGLGKDKIQFERRGHKLLFYLNVLMTDNQRLGATKARNKEFQILLQKLQEEFPGEKGRLPNLISASDKVWNDIEQASKAGLMKEGEPFRYFRQHSSPGESPFSHEVKLLQQASKADDEAAKAAKITEQKTPEQIQDEKLKAAFAKGTTEKRDTNIMAQALQELFPGKKWTDLTDPTDQSKVARRAGEIAKELNKGKK